MLAQLSCQGDTFNDLCRWIDDHDPTGSGLFGPVVAHLFAPLLVLVIVVVCGRLIRHLFVRTPAIAGNAQVRTLVANVLTAAIYVLAVMSALVAAGLNISVLLTFGGLASLAIGLAFQDVLRNILAGIFLLVEQPFKIGDSIKVGAHSGTVQTIQLRTTALKTVDARIVVLPNLTCFNEAIVNESASAQRRFTVSVRLGDNVKFGDAVTAAEKALTGHKAIANKPAPQVRSQLDDETAVILHCDYWLDHKTSNVVQVASEIATELAPLRQPAS